MMSSELGLIAVVLIFWLLLKKSKENLPPGPTGFPLIGNALSVSKKSYETFGNWAKKYGGIITVNVFGTRIIVISDIELATEAYNKPSLLGRAMVDPFEIYFRGNKEYPKEVARGVVSSEGSQWVEQRRFTISNLRDLGLGKQTMEEQIQDEASHLMSYIESVGQKPVNLWRPFAQASSNVLWKVIVGERFDHDVEKSSVIEQALHELLEHIDSPISVFLPRISNCMERLFGWKRLLIQSSNEMQKIFHSYVDASENKYQTQENNVPNNFVEAYLQKISKTVDPSSSFYKHIGVDSLRLTVADLYIAGSETTAAALNWAVLYLTTFPEIQNRFVMEIHDVIGRSRVPSLGDRTKMPYTEAIIYETLRKSSFASFGVMHRATADTIINGYTIPKDAWVCVNQHFIHHDPKVWEDPDNFQPERFLTNNPDGTICLKRYKEFIPFSIGKRRCIGEQLTKDEIFHFLCIIYQKYSTIFDPASPKPSLEPRTVMFKQPPLFSIVLNERKL